jgi:glycerol-3-phosphate dehydrogenase
VLVENGEAKKSLRVHAKVIVSAAGPFSDQVAQLDDPQATPRIVPSQGIHLVFDQEFMPGDTALIVPKTRDGRVVFAIPWHGHVVVGTTDTALGSVSLEPRPATSEIEFLLDTIAPYWTRKPHSTDIRSIFAGIRPLVRSGDSRNTAKLARNHVIRVSSSRMISIMGGKWTTYRKMAEDGVDRAIEVGGLLPTPCRTKNLSIHGAQGEYATGQFARLLTGYGSDGPAISQLAASRSDLAAPLADRLPHIAAQVVWAARYEMARSVEDVLARRTRSLFLDADAAVAAAPRVAELLAAELDRDAQWQIDQLAAFNSLAEGYRYHSDA